MRLTLLSTLLLSLIFATDSPVPISPSPPAPEGEVGRRVFTELGAYYADHKRPPDFARALDDLRSSDESKRRAAGAYLLALFVQLETDERRGRAEWKPTPYWGQGAQSDARDLRSELAERFGAEAEGDAAFEAMAWLVEHEPVPAIQASGMSALGRLRSQRLPELLDRTLSTPHTNSEVLVAALREAQANPQARFRENILRLCGHFQSRVREAARAAAVALALKAPEFDGARALAGPIEPLMRDVLARLTVREPRDARWLRVQATSLPDRAGWLLEETDSTVRILSAHGRDVTIPRSGARLTEGTLEEEAARWVRLRAEAPDGRSDSLSLLGSLTGQFEAEAISVPEALIAAWSLERGDRASAARLLLPCLDRLVDVREFDWILRDQLGDVAHHAMLAAFSYDRDYARTIVLANHLGGRKFDGYRYHERARELAAQLSRRGTDFRTFVLPDSSQWAALRSTLSRREQIQYVTSRLRLLNCFQWMQPGDVGFADPQYERPLHYRYPFDERGSESPRVINPFVELLALKPGLADFDALAPFVLDRNFMPTFGFWRDFHPDRELHRVCELVQDVINGAARKTLVDAEVLAALPERERRAAIVEAGAWAREHSQASPAELHLEVLRTSTVQNEFWRAMEGAAREKDAAAAPLVLARMEEFPHIRDRAINALYEMGARETLPAARRWIREPLDTYHGNMARQGLDALSNRTIHFWAAMILLRGGEEDRGSALAMLDSLFADDNEMYWAPMATDSLLATAGAAGEQLLCRTFRAPGVGSTTDARTGSLLRALLRAGCRPAFEFIHSALADTSQARTEDTVVDRSTQFRRRSRADDLALSVSRWPHGPRLYDWGAPDETRASQRQTLRAWLAEEFARVKAGSSAEF